MFICICRAVSDDDVSRAIDDGADTVDAVSSATRAGTGCGSCHGQIEAFIEQRCGSCPLAAMQVA